MKILVVEDNADNQVLVGRYLRSTSAIVSFAWNGKEAIERLQSENFDVILMDLQMPILDGNTATRMLRTKGFNKPILAVTAHALREERDRALQIGFNAYLSKPLSRQNLIEALVRYFYPFRTAPLSLH